MFLVKLKFNTSKVQTQCIIFTPRRFKSWKKDHWHAIATKKTATIKALEHFDQFYKSVFRLKWPSARLGLLTPQKYVALVNNFGDVEKTENSLQNLGAINIKTCFEIFEKNLKQEEAINNRQATLGEVFALDKLMDEKTKEEEEKDLNILYPDGSGEKLKGLLFTKKDEDSVNQLEEGNTCTYERVIDPDLGIDSGALHDYIPATKLKGMDDYVPEAEYYSYYKPTIGVPLTTEKQYKLNYPLHLRAFTYNRGIFEEYPSPRRTSTGVYNYYLMDGASLLPVLALDLKFGDTVLDMCSAPGGKSLAILQTLTPKLLVCNDLSTSRVNRIHKVLSQYLYDYATHWKGMLSVRQGNGMAMDESNVFDKILVDVPCTNDRLSLHEDDNNIFKQSRLKERLRIPETQAALLVNALHLVKPGGTVVYSTCSLSPVQNDGVVGMALRRMWEERKQEFTIIDMTPALTCTSELFSYGKNIGLKYGSLVVPFLPSNFGPMYFCKFVKKL